MDDEALARMLQEEELRAAQALQQQLQLQGRAGPLAADGTGAFQARLQSMMETALRCEDHGLQERARAVMPLARMRAAAAEAASLAARLGADVASAAAGSADSTAAEEDLLAQQLLAWFKCDFFSWVDTLPCPRCGSGGTHSDGALVQPLPEDLAHGAQRVELHRCRRPGCGGSVRFPRYNNPGKLLEQGCRRGRCGEWANAFLLCCRAAGLTARYVSDWSDHVWTEYYSHRQRRWIHLDSCEAAYDKPLLYEAGWGKAQSYVVAAGVWGATDVTPRYTAKWRREVRARRTLVPERWLARTLAELTAGRRGGWPGPKRLVWLGRDAEERVELLRQRLGLPAARPQQQALPGRQTGSLEWRQQRGETGASASAAPAPREPTSYRLAPDVPGAQLPAVFGQAGRLGGGACRAAGHNGAVEVVERLFDGRVSTKWLDFGGGGVGGSSWAEYRIPLDRPAVVVSGYELVSANDCPERDPAAWRLEGVAQADFEAGRPEQWQVLDSRSGVRFPGRNIPMAFHLSASPPQQPYGAAAPPPCRRLRLRIDATADPGTANSVQLSCWSLYGHEVAAAAAAAGAGAGPGAAAATATAGDRVDVPLERLRAAAAGGGGGVDPAAASLAVRLLENVCREPQEVKFRKVRHAKLGAILTCAPVADVLMRHCRFRPLLLPAEPVSAVAAAPAAAAAQQGPAPPAGEDVFLVLAADPSGQDVARAAEALEVLRPLARQQ
ncbi:hypothetical protein HYH02_012876 [Chlamydomonas schloesseri]|uniref:Transglutaminase-like domain-containing protein n=1 Tax=Chlamydomonas schloesseri TaxID=2026947 RepID=A0A835SSW1_9CHLO|nr:hypothetical protein HYH02_012876 [Chlamydomonas schloesseri]|eukprot:KAG2432742.1 hypothetical protein HYH02_012876 [Chlamydomonas schloesseri]